MTNDAKVINLRDSGNGTVSRLPAPLIRLRDLSANALRQLLGESFDGADDALFNMADKAGSNAEQSAYFDAMRELRLRRKQVTLSMLQWVARAFNEIGRFSPRPHRSGMDQVDRDELSLVDNSQLEEQVALDGMINKTRAHNDELLRMLDARLAQMLPGVSLGTAQNPLSPEVLCSGLGEACTELNIDIRAKLIVFKLFDKLLIARLEQLYREANDFLAREGVMPEMRRAPVQGSKRQASSAARISQPSPQSYEAGDEDSNHSFNELTALLRDGRGSSDGTQNGPVLATAELLSALSQMQYQVLPSAEALPGISGGNLQSCIGSIASSSGQSQGQPGQVDSDVINLVSMLFDFILEDRQLPEAMKALLARLQIPVLKVALLDRSFFNRGGHPARKLLNELAMAAIGWNERPEGQRDPLREKIESVVERLLNEFTDNIELFAELLEDFTRFMGLEQRRRELVEQRLRDVEEGRARQEQAKERVEQLLAAHTEGRDIPENVQQLLNDAWTRFLQWTYLRQGPESEEWSKAERLTEQLVWSVSPQPVAADTRRQLLKAIPGIVDGVRSGLQTISWDPFATDRLVRDLELTHVDTLQNLVSFREAPVVAPVEEVVSDPAPRLPVEPEAPVEALQAEPEVPVVESPAPVAEMPVSPPVEAEVAAPVTIPDAEAAAPELAVWEEKAHLLRVGSWFELVPPGETKLRCKLAAVIKATGKYIFVNRSGAKVAEQTLKEVAQAMADERLVMLDDGLIFDRALESIIDNLRSNRRD